MFALDIVVHIALTSSLLLLPFSSSLLSLLSPLFGCGCVRCRWCAVFSIGLKSVRGTWLFTSDLNVAVILLIRHSFFSVFFSAVVRSFICSICCYYSHSCVQPLCSLQNLSRVSLLGIMCNATHLCGCWRLFRIIACQKKLFLVRAYTAPVILCFIKMTLYQFRRALHFHCSVNFSSNQSNNEKIWNKRNALLQ